jgi:hypothetical protein
MKKTTLLTLVCLLGLTMTAGSAFASGVLLAPAGSVPLVAPDVTAPAGGALLADLIAPFSILGALGQVLESGTVESRVYRDGTTGTMDFFYQVHNNATSLDHIDKLTANSFLGFLTSVGFNNVPSPAGTVAPNSANRSLSGDTVEFDFPNALAINPGLTGDWLFIQTNAPTFMPGVASVIDGGAVTVASFAPSAVPIPPSALLLGSGLLGLVGLRRFRKS